MVYFIADTHFGHENILKLCDRPFDTIKEMNETIVRNWNKRVKGSDTIYILGDLFFKCEDPGLILWRLNGKKRLIVGNYDEQWMKRVNCAKYFASVDELIQISYDGYTMTLCHYPMLSWNRQMRSFMVFGHIHANTDMEFWPYIKARDNMLNAGVDVNGYMPVTFDEMLANNRRFKEAH